MKSWLPTAAFGIVVGATCAAMIGLPQIRDLEQEFGLPWLFHLRGATKPPAEVVMVVMDQRASANISLPRDPEKFHRCEDVVVGATPATHVSVPTMPSRWPRCLHAKLVSKLVDAGAAVVAFDVLFRERPPLPGAAGDLHAWQDETLASTLRSSHRAVIAQKIEITEGHETLPVLSRSIEDAALGSAPFPLVTSNGRRVDGFLAFKEAGLVTPTLPVIAVQAYRISVYPELTGLLARYAGADAELLPSSEQAFAAGGHLQTIALLIRELFRSDNTLAGFASSQHHTERGVARAGLGVQR
jgi:adenylate cyclase